MCNANCIIFGVNNLSQQEVADKRVIEVGSLDVNGSLRPIIEKLKPAEYIGVDIEEGEGVDIICRVEDLVNKFGKNSFDAVISNELLEHVRNWRIAISNLKNICRPGGIILITTRSYGFPYHSYPHDYWRYEVNDMKHIFSDFKILALRKDPQDPGVFLKIQKPNDFVEKKLNDYSLYNIVINKRIQNASKYDVYNIHFFFLLAKNKFKNILRFLFS